jgi:cysteine desulfurase
VDAQGLVSPDELAEACLPDTRLASVMLANNETGAIQPVTDISARLAERGVPLHSDAAQAVGKIPVDVKALGVDFMTIAGHKLYAPKGIGALYIRGGRELPSLLLGGGQEGGRRSGTENVAYMVALGEACALAREDLDAEGRRQREMGQMFLKGLREMGADFILHAEEAPRLPGTMFIGFKGLSAGDIISGLVGMDVAVSAGAACHDDSTSLSHVLTAMQASPDYAAGTIRFSWGRPTSREDMAELLQRLTAVLKDLG